MDLDAPPRSTLALLRDPLFGPFFFGKLVSLSGIWVFNLAAAVIAWDVGQSTFLVGMVSVALFLPQLLFAPLSGAHADRGDPKVQLILGRAFVAMSSAGLAIAVFILGVDGLPGVWPVILAAATCGMGFVIGGPAQHAVLPALVQPSELSTAVGLNTLPATVARAAGPPLGALLLLTAGPSGAFAYASAANITFGVIVLVLPLRGLVARASVEDSRVRAGVPYLRRTPTVGLLLIATLAIGLGADPVITLTPALSAWFGYGEGLVGLLTTAFGAGAAVGYLLLAPLRRIRPRSDPDGLGFAALAVGLAMTGLAPSVALAIAGHVLAGLGFCWSLTGTTTRLYEQVPETLRGRIMALWSMAYLGSRPAGAALSGYVADTFSIETAYVGVGLLVGAIGAAAIRLERRSQVPSAAGETRSAT